jgi:hypothetical protein
MQITYEDIVRPPKVYSGVEEWIDGPCLTKQWHDRGADDTPRAWGDDGHKFPSTWVQMAIIAMNSASEAIAAASWIRALNIGSLPGASNSNASGSVPVGT